MDFPEFIFITSFFCNSPLKLDRELNNIFWGCIMPAHREQQVLPSRWSNISFFGYNKIQYIYNLPANSTSSVPIAAAH